MTLEEAAIVPDGLDVPSGPKLRIAQVAPPLEAVPPAGYGGTERVIEGLVRGLVKRGHDVTTFATGDSEIPGRHAVTLPRAMRPLGFGGDPSPYLQDIIGMVLDRAGEFDVIHGHLEWFNPILARTSPAPAVMTFHGRLDFPWARDILLRSRGRYVAISRSHAAAQPDLDWAGIVLNGLDLTAMPFQERRSDGLCFVGRIAPEKGVIDAIEIAGRTGRLLRIAAKAGKMPHEVDYEKNVFLPAVAAAGSAVEFLGELSVNDRDLLFADSYAALMPGHWPEPFGLVAIEALAAGTPVVARPVGAIPEILRPGVDGFFGDSVETLAEAVDRVGELDRLAIRASVLERFSAARMTVDYEAVYRRLLDGSTAADPRRASAGS